MSQNKKSKYRVTRITANDLDLPWLCSTPRNYKAQIVTLKRSMGARYHTFSELVSLLLNHVDEAQQIRRIMPKTEWVLAHGIQITMQQRAYNYLLVVGAEIQTQSRGMAYGSSEDRYDCQNCYYVIGSEEALHEDKFGLPSGERLVHNTRYHEYNNNRVEVHNLVLQLIKIIMSKENLSFPT